MTRPEFTRSAVLRGGSMVAAGSIFSSLLAAAFTTILGVQLGDEGYGKYAFVIATAGLLGTLSRVGLEPIVVRDIARSIDPEEAALGRREPVLTATAVTVSIAFVLALLTISPLGVRILERAGDLDLSMVGALTVLFVAQAVYTINAESLRGLHRLGGAAFVGLPVQRLVSLALVAFVVYVMAVDLDAALALWLTAAAAGSALIVSTAILWVRMRPLAGGRPKRGASRTMARDGAPVLLSNVLGMASSRLPIWVLAILGTLDQAGTFALAAAYVTLVRLAHKTTTSTLSPFIAASYYSGERSGLERRVRVAVAAASLLVIAAALGLVVVGSLVVRRVFGANFENAVPVASVLLLGTVATAVTGPSGLLLNVTGNERWLARASAISVGLAVVAIFPASALGGAIGAAATMAASAMVNAALQVRYTLRTTGISPLADFPALFRTVRRFWK